MIRTGVLIIAVLVMLPGTALAQGLLDSIFGSGGLGIWGSQPGNQFDSPQYYGGTSAQGQQGVPPGYGYTSPQQAAPQAQGYAYQQQVAPQVQGYGYPQQGYAQQTYPQGQAPGYRTGWH